MNLSEMARKMGKVGGKVISSRKGHMAKIGRIGARNRWKKEKGKVKR